MIKGGYMNNMEIRECEEAEYQEFKFKNKYDAPVLATTIFIGFMFLAIILTSVLGANL